MADSMPAGPPVFPPPQNPHDLGRGPLIVGMTWTFTGLAVIFTMLRVFCRNNKSRWLSSDDWLMFLAMLLQVANQILVTISFSWGMGKHDADLKRPEELVQVLRWNWMAMAPGIMVSILARVSITILLIRIFGSRKWFMYFLLALTSVQVVIAFIILICTWLQIKPVEALWNIFLPTEYRWDPRILLYLQYTGQSLYTFADLAYVVLPISIIWKLNMTLKRRLGLVFLLGLSGFTAVISIMKTVVARSSVGVVEDAQYKASLSVLWSSMEQGCVIFLGCVPPLYSNLKTGMHLATFGRLKGALYNALRSFIPLKSNLVSRDTSNRDNSEASRADYYDLDTSTHRLGGQANGRNEIKRGHVIEFDDSKSSRGLTFDSQGRRTDTFTITYNNKSSEDSGSTRSKERL
ncbi:hypothetical protein HIM_10851 [Hirsutella minnesotensis 3608]|uniref:Rhodopsin domain-containing protein n=1 Tax=Hirsutella minnesotensis 3608 TaxID=1043627 RepID=A0A0F7ZRK4_9HYPO|nr:hypothetical protein HIM_10851 [Hirsutella minnesotensis 3608]